MGVWPHRRYTGRMLIDEGILNPSEAPKKFFAAETRTPVEVTPRSKLDSSRFSTAGFA